MSSPLVRRTILPDRRLVRQEDLRPPLIGPPPPQLPEDVTNVTKRLVYIRANCCI